MKRQLRKSLVMVLESNVVQHSVFPTLITQTTLDLDVERMASEILDIHSTLDSNYSGGYTSYGESGAIHSKFKNVYGIEELYQSIRRLCDIHDEAQHFVAPNPPKVYAWVNVMTRGGMHGIHDHENSDKRIIHSGTFYVRWLPGMSQIKFHSPLRQIKQIEPGVFPPGDYSKYNKPSFTLDTPPNTLLMWPSWLSHEVPPMLVDGPRITISFNVNY